MTDSGERNVGLMIAAGALLVAAFVNLVSGFLIISDRPHILDTGYIPAAINYWGWSSMTFGVFQGVGALLLLQHKREGAAIAYTMTALAAVYWVASFPVRPLLSVIALAALAATVTLIVINRDALD